jgi:hypothetical protein
MMRRLLWLGTVLAGLCLAGTASAQVTTNVQPNGSFVVTRVPTTTGANASYTRTALLDHFRISNVLQGLTNIWKPQPYAVGNSIPDPSSPDYLKAFGFQRFGR